MAYFYGWTGRKSGGACATSIPHLDRVGVVILPRPHTPDPGDTLDHPPLVSISEQENQAPREHSIERPAEKGSIFYRLASDRQPPIPALSSDASRWTTRQAPIEELTTYEPG